MERKLNRIEMPDSEMVRVLREKTGQERLEIGFGTWRFAKQNISAEICDQHPDWMEEEVNQDVSRRMFGGTMNEDIW
jgi:hypothetical protein